MPQSAPDIEITEDLVLGGHVKLRQPKIGYRAGLDAALLAAACDVSPGARVLDVGCGVGAVMLAAAARRAAVQFMGLERDEAAFQLARQNIALNGMAERVDVVAGDVGRGFRSLGLKPFDAAISNPPFFDDPTSLRGPHPARADAYITDGGLEAWLAFLLKAVREGGTITVIHRADRLADLLAGLGAKAGSFRIRPIQPFADAPAKRVLVRAIKTGKAPLALLPALVLHERDGAKHGAHTEAILRGEDNLGWG